MSFISFEFLFIFLPIFYILYFLINNISFRNSLLLVFSLFFYAWGEPKRIALLLILILLCYVFAYMINRYKKRLLLFILIFILIFPLIMYKYFLNEMPIGISFYTFQLLSYLIDVYMNRCDFEKNIFKLAIYFSMFPIICSGPILRYKDIKDSISGRTVKIDDIEKGLSRFIIGLSKKIILANNLAQIADVAFGIDVHLINANMAWVGSIAYMLQIYYDFSGYSDMAIGLGKMLGFSFKENFNSPYLSRSVTDFWRRWHISLGSWFRDYIYIPLGGNRVSTLRWAFNILIVWTLTGIWHGSSLNFITWGLFYGVMLIIEKKYLRHILEKHVILSHIYTLSIIFFGWIIFRIQNVADIPYFVFALIDVRNIGTITELAGQNVLFDIIYIIIGIVCLIPVVKKPFINIFKHKIIYEFVIVILLIISIVLIENGSYKTFLYFKF